jgi:hypothetical protein
MVLSSAASQNLFKARYAFSLAHLEIRRLRLAYALKRFNPNQPRVPAGNADGGQWTDGDDGGAAAGRDREPRRTYRPPLHPVGGFEPEHLGMTVQDFVSAYCSGNIRSVLPGQFLGSTISEVMQAAKRGDAPARRCLKILGRDRFRK